MGNKQDFIETKQIDIERQQLLHSSAPPVTPTHTHTHSHHLMAEVQLWYIFPELRNEAFIDANKYFDYMVV